MADDKFSKIEQRIKQLDARIKALGGEGFPNLDKTLKGMNGDLEAATRLMKLLADEANDLENVFENISTTLKNVVLDLNGGTKATTLMNRSFSKLERIADKLVDHRKDENILTIKQLKNLAKQTKAEVENLALARDKAVEEKKALQKKEKSGKLTKAEQDQLEKNTTYISETTKALNLKNSYLKQIVKFTDQEVKNEEKIQKTLGFTGQLFKGIAGTLQKIGVESEAIEDIQLSMRKAAKEGNGFNVMGAAIKGTFNAVKESLNDPAVQITLFLKTFKTLYEVGTQFSQRTAEIARNMGINTQQAREYNQALIQAFKTSKEQAASIKAFEEANANINDYLGTSVVFSSQILENQTALVKRAGLTNEEAARLAELSFVNGKTQEEIYDSIGKQNKGILSNRKVLGQVLKISGQLAAQYKNNPKLLAQAVVQANKLGLTLEQTQKISKGLLNFEDSISKELSAELLTGKNLNLEKARYLALQGKSAEAAEEIAKQVGSSAEFSRMNVIQQEALAEATGMSVDELADSLVKREAIAKLQSDEFRRTGVMLSNEEASTKLKEQQMSASEKMAASMEALKDSISSIIAGPLGKMVDMVSGLFNKISQSDIAKAVLGVAGGIGASIAAVGSALVVGKGIINSFRGKPSGRAKDPINVRDVSGGGMSTGGDSTSSSGGFGKNLKRVGKAFQKGGVKGGIKSISRIGKSLFKGGGKGLLKGGLKGIPMAGALLSAGLDFAEGGLNWETAGRAGLSGLGSFGGGLLGSLVAPGVGTVGGAVGGSMLGDWLGDKIFGERETPPAEDFIMQNGTLTRFRKDDVVVGGTNLGGGNSPEVVALLKELITAVKSGGDVYLDGTKVGTAMAMSTYKTQ